MKKVVFTNDLNGYDEDDDRDNNDSTEEDWED